MVKNSYLAIAIYLSSLAWPDRFFPFLFVVAEPQIKMEKVVWPRKTTISHNYEVLDSCLYLVSYGYLHHLYTTCTHHRHFNGTIVEPVCVNHITMYICMYVCMYTT